MGLDQIVNELVCRDGLFSFLDVNDLLRLRRVSKSVKNMAEDYIRTKKVQTSRELHMYLRQRNGEFEENDQLLRNSNGLPIRTKASFGLGEEQHGIISLGAPLESFLARCAASITHLTIHNLKIPIYSEAMIQFFESFPNIKSLDLDGATGGDEAEAATVTTCKIPTTFENIKELKITYHEDFWWANTVSFLVQLLDTCIANLETFALPQPSVGWDSFDMDVDFGPSRQQVIHFYRTILFTAPNLKLTDVEGEAVRRILLLSRKRNPRLGTIHAIADSLSSKVTFLQDPHATSFLLVLPNLEKIEIESLRSCSLPNPVVPQMKDWPKLKDIKVELAGGVHDRYYVPEQVLPRQMWNLLFVGIRRENVVKLDIKFGRMNRDETFAAADVLASCPNLKSLRFEGELSKLQEMCRFFRELIHLEELCFARCTDLTNEVLVGEDTEHPAIWSLKNLKVLEFEVVNCMKITDDLFKNVLCHMPLKKLVLTSIGYTVTTITLDGIRSLLSGVFASTVESLPFRDLELEGVSRQEMEEVENLFRSSKMR